MRKLIVIILMGCIFSAGRLAAQVDPHFTQYYAYPVWLNPAFTGLIDGNYRVTANYRQQLPSLYAPMNNQAISADFALPKNFGLGITVLKQSSTDAGYQLLNSYFSLSYQAHLGKYQILSSGFQLGILNRKVDPGKLQFGNQFNPAIGYDPSIPSSEIFAYQSATSVDGSFGLLYFDGDPNKKINPYIGVSLYHPTQPNSRFLSAGDDNRIDLRYSFHAGVRLQMGSRASLIPHILYQQQGDATEMAGGLVCNLKIEEGKDFILGGTYRKDDAIAPNIGLHINGLTIGFSYDVAISKLKTAASSNGGYELSISFTGRKKIPDTKFICPRL